VAAKRNAKGQFKRQPARERTEAYNRRLRNQIVRARREGYTPSRSELRGHAPKPSLAYTEASGHDVSRGWGFRPSSRRFGRMDVYGVYRIRYTNAIPPGDKRYSTRTAFAAPNVTRRELFNDPDMYEQLARRVILSKADQYEYPYEIVRFMGFRALKRT
jgi:hypothetical protein